MFDTQGRSLGHRCILGYILGHTHTSHWVLQSRGLHTAPQSFAVDVEVSQRVARAKQAQWDLQ